MKLDEGKMTEYLDLPAEEAEKVIEAMKQAEQTNDIEALKWCARRLAWLDDVSEIGRGDDIAYPAHLFNKAWVETLKNDPPPESILGIIARIDHGKDKQAPEIKPMENRVMKPDIKSSPVIGDAIVAVFKNHFYEKYTEANGEMKGIKFWPAELVEETYRKAAAEIGGENEVQALKTFYAEMVRFLRMGTYEYFDIEEDDYILGLLEGETE